MSSTPTTSLESWISQDAHVERLLESAALTAVSPEDTLVIVGPPRFHQLVTTEGSQNYLVVGLLQQVSWNQGANTQPFKALGSARNFFIRDSPPGTATVSRLWVNGRNLLRALYTFARQQNLDVSKFQSSPVPEGKDGTFPTYMDLNSELFYLGFGMGIIFGDKTHSEVGSCYLEDTHITGYGTGVTSGATATLENVSLIFDRLVPMTLSDQARSLISGGTNDVSTAIKNILGVTGNLNGTDSST